MGYEHLGLGGVLRDRLDRAVVAVGHAARIPHQKEQSVSKINGVPVLTGAEMATECGITRQSWEGWIARHEDKFPPDFQLEMGKKVISAWLPSTAKRIVEARQP
jgi:hypothetical protein